VSEFYPTQPYPALNHGGGSLLGRKWIDCLRQRLSMYDFVGFSGFVKDTIGMCL